MLKQENELIESSIVVNSRMNRSRTSVGVNSYQRELKFNLEEFLLEKLNKYGKCSWLDICCGEGNAMMDFSKKLKKQGYHDHLHFVGLDLIDVEVIDELKDCAFLNIISNSMVEYELRNHFDLITCVHGLHYIGDKIAVIIKAIENLTDEGFFIAHLDLSNIKIKNDNNKNEFNKFFKSNGIKYQSKSKILSKQGPAKIENKFHFLGADDDFGPNYTGQDSVLSFYEYTSF